MRRFSARSAEAELMDGAAVTQSDFAACLHSLSKVNLLTLARRPTLAWLWNATTDLAPGCSFTLLDVGFGEGDMLRAVHGWAVNHGFRPRLAGVDLNPRSAPIAAARTDPQLGIVYTTGDALTHARPVDFIISSLTAHHMSDEEIVSFIRWMEATAQRGWFINDLHRNAIAFYGFKALAWVNRWHRFVQHDGPISIARGFRRDDWRRLISAAKIDSNAVSVRWRFPFRLCVGRIK